MSKKDKRKAPRAAQIARDTVRDWQPLFEQLTEVIDWALEIAAKLSRHHPEDLASIERVRTFVHGWLEGRRAEVPITDVLTAIAIVLSAIELDLGIDSVSLLEPLRTMLESLSMLPAFLRCPGAVDHDAPTVIVRRFPGRRNVRSGFTHLAA